MARGLHGSARLHVAAAIVAAFGMAFVAGCGGGGAEPAPEPVACQGSLAIDTPTYAASWQTDRPEIEIAGWAPTPGGPYSGNCPSDPHYAIAWQNSANGASGAAAAWTSLHYGLLGPYCSTRWGTTTIPLALGDNRIRVSGAAVGEACIVIQRLPDTTPPAVVWTSPADGAVDVPANATISVEFDEPIERATLTAASFFVTDQHGSAVPGGVVVDAGDRTARFLPAGSLTFPRTYTATVTTAVRDAFGGNPMAASRRWSFSTGAAADTTPPAVIATSPPADSACLATLGTISGTFDEPIDPTTLSSATFFVRDATGRAVPGTVSYVPPSARFQPSAALSGGVRYTATLGAGIKDLAGNPTARDDAWSFTTGSEFGNWQRTATNGAPTPRSGHVAVWTGTAMIVAGGFTYLPEWNRFDFTATGARYDPALDAWSPIAPGAPPRMNASAVWTGREMMVWGGTAGSIGVAAGAAYDPSTDRWRTLPSTGAPPNAAQHTAVWTGREMIVWGGVDAAFNRLGVGARYDAAADAWRPLSGDGAPSARAKHSAVWTGREMIVWGGEGAGSDLDTGARYDPVVDAWRPLSTAGAPSRRASHTAVWTGDEMIVWGSRFGTTASGGRYDAATDTWRPTSTLCTPSGREGHVAVWTGSRMLIWGGYSGAYTQLYIQGAAYDPAADAWQAMASTDAPGARFGHSGLWAGTRLIVWGGRDSGPFDSGGRFAP